MIKDDPSLFLFLSSEDSAIFYLENKIKWLWKISVVVVKKMFYMQLEYWERLAA